MTPHVERRSSLLRHDFPSLSTRIYILVIKLPNLRRRVWRLALYGLVIGLSSWSLSAPGLAGKTHDGERISVVGTRQGTAQQGEKDVRPLVSGQAIKREITGEETHFYQITLAAGQYMHAVIEQGGIDMIATLSEQNGQQINQFDCRWQGPEPISLIAEAHGVYQLAVRTVQKIAARVVYEIRLEEIRSPLPQDQSRISAERISADGKRLIAQANAQALRQAMEKYEQGLSLWQEIGDQSGQAQTLNSLGFLYNELGQPRKAIDYYSQALPLRQSLNDLAGESETLLNIAAAYSALGEKPQALVYYEQVLPISRKSGNRLVEAHAFTNIAGIHHLLGESGIALSRYDQALGIWKDLGHRAGEANAHLGVGAIRSLQGEKQLALSHYNQAFDLSRAAKDVRGEAYSLHNIGRIYGDLSEHSQAVDYYQRAIPRFQSIGDRRGEATAFHNLGTATSSLGGKQEAFNHYSKALSIWREVRDRYGESQTLLNLGKLYDESSERPQAMDRYNSVLPIFREVGNRYGEAAALHNLGALYASTGEKHKAIEHYAQALPIWRALGDGNSEAMTLSHLARAQSDLGNLDEARVQAEAALKLVESLRIKVANPELRATYFASAQDYYQFYVDLLLRRHQRQPGAGYDGIALQVNESIVKKLFGLATPMGMRKGNLAPHLLEAGIKSLRKL